MYRPEVTDLFKYYGNHDYALDVIKCERVFCSTASKFNDPFDGTVPFDLNLVDSDCKNIASFIRLGRINGDSLESIKRSLDDFLAPNAHPG